VTEFGLERFEAGDDAELVVVTGTVGAPEARDLTEALEACGRDGARRVVVDVTDAAIDDPDALSGLYDLARLMRARDGLVAIAAPRRHELRGILQATGVHQAFTLYDSRRAALDDLDLDG
jgi:anti-anti-sigma regulatory factor